MYPDANPRHRVRVSRIPRASPRASPRAHLPYRRVFASFQRIPRPAPLAHAVHLLLAPVTEIDNTLPMQATARPPSARLQSAHRGRLLWGYSVRDAGQGAGIQRDEPRLALVARILSATRGEGCAILRSSSLTRFIHRPDMRVDAIRANAAAYLAGRARRDLPSDARLAVVCASLTARPIASGLSQVETLARD